MKQTSWNEVMQHVKLGKWGKTAMMVGLFVAAMFMFVDLGGVLSPQQAVNSIDQLPVAAELEIDSEDEKFYFRKTFINDNHHRCQNKLGYMLNQKEVQRFGDRSNNENNSSLRKYGKVGMRYVVGTYNRSSDIDDAVEFVIAARKMALRPIIVIGTESNTSFLQTQNIIDFYRSLSEQTGESKFVATLAVSFEVMSTRVSSKVGAAVAQQMGQVANALAEDHNIAFATPIMQESRACGAGDAESSCLKVSDELALFAERIFLYEGGLDRNWIDYYLVNWHNHEDKFKFAKITKEGEYAKDQEESSNPDLRAHMAYEKLLLGDLNTNLEEYKMFHRVIVMDYAPNPETIRRSNGQRISNKILQERIMHDYGLLSDDPRIAGIVVGEKMDKIFRDFDDYEKLTLQGTNCNYDLIDYKIPYDDNSVAKPVGKKNESKPAKDAKATTRVICSGNTAGGEGGLCVGEVMITMKVGLPIKQCGSNSPFGTDGRPYAPPSVNAALRYNVPLDYLNQNAGAIVSNSSSVKGEYDNSRYTVPWLNNCLASNYPDYTNSLPPESTWQMRTNFNIAEDDLYKSHLNRGLTIANTKAENNAETSKFRILDVLVPDEAKRVKYLDERTVVWGRDVPVAKGFIQLTAGFNNYSLLDYSAHRYTKNVNIGGGKVTSIVDDPRNMIYGDEVVVYKEKVFEKGANQLAWEEYRHRLQSGGNLFTSKLVYELQPSAGNPNTCPCILEDQFGNVQRRSIADQDAIRQGCRVPNESQIINSGRCIKYRGGEGIDSLDTYEESDFFKQASFPKFPKYSIPGAYDALAAAYNRVQTKLSAMGLKLIVNTKTGWEADLSMKSYVVPPFFKPYLIKGGRTNNMVETYNFAGASVSAVNSELDVGSVQGASTENDPSCKVGVNFASTAVSTEQANEAGTNGGYGYGYGQVLTTGKNVSKDAASVNAMCQAGMVPILRYCYSERGACAFTDGTINQSNAESRGAALANYYAQVAAAANSCKGSQMQVVCGHNEPITEFAGLYFSGNTQEGMQVEGAFSKGCVQAIGGREISGVSIQATTSIFNGTIADAPDGASYQSFETNMQNYAAGYGSQLSADLSSGKLACLAFNVYSNAGNLTAGEHYKRYKSNSTFANANTCVMETGWFNASSVAEQSSKASEVVSSLEESAGEELLYYLYFNATRTGGSQWENFGLDEATNNEIAKCTSAPKLIDGGNTTGNYKIPGFHLLEQDKYLTEGDNFVRQKQYYEYLGELELLNRIDSVFTSENTVPLNIAAASTLLLRCDSAQYNSLPPKVRQNTNCLAPYSADSTSAGYTKDPLGRFLCDKGYPVVGEVCDLQCIVPARELGSKPTDSGNTSQVANITSDLPGGLEGLMATGTADDFIATKNYSSAINIVEAAEQNNMGVATNANFMQRAEGGSSAEWLWAGGGSSGITKANRFSTVALIKHNGQLQADEGDQRFATRAFVDTNGDGLIIPVATSKLAILDIEAKRDPDAGWYQNRDSLNFAEIESQLRGRVQVAATGVPLLVVNGVPLSEEMIRNEYTSASWGNKVPRTILGFTGNTVKIITLARADLRDMINAAVGAGLDNAIGLDGGGSTQMYISSGVPNGVTNSPNNSNSKKVYWPGNPGSNESGPRLRDFYIGFSQQGDSTSNAGGGQEVLIPSGRYTCPVLGGYCIQGPTGQFSHATGVKKNNAVDLKPGDSNDRDIIAPFDGKIIKIEGSECADSNLNGGDGFIFRGKYEGEEIDLLFTHIRSVNDAGEPIINAGDTFRQGQKITELATIGSLTRSGGRVNSTTCRPEEYGDSNVHLHIELDGVSYEQRDMMAIVNSFGCSPGNPSDFNGCTTNSHVPGNEDDELICEVVNPSDENGVSSSTTFDTLEDLIAAVARSVSANYKPLPPQALKAIMSLETRAFINPQTGVRYTGDPTEAGEVNANSANAAGPMQFTPIGWQDVATMPAVTQCLSDIGMNLPSLSLEDRIYLGPALCAGGVKIAKNANDYVPGPDFGISDWDVRSINWQSLPIITLYSDADLQVNSSWAGPVSPMHVAAHRYLGACTYADTNGNVESYCEWAYQLMQRYKSDF